MEENRIAREVVDAALEVHRTLGPGLLESVYRRSLALELGLRDLKCAEEVPLNASYKGLKFGTAYRLDLEVSGLIIVEVKSVDTLLPVHAAQLLSYLRLANRRLGLLINFHVPLLKDGIKRVVNKL
ncbi:MAG: GxxExxY protein [Proteobacteria bacterium]|nr:MAG: GxxExxY protein [Pseudomonadota bacterium]QKK12648.1 MAG: GxxExxY protein [Pseudomonadota bacterium]